MSSKSQYVKDATEGLFRGYQEGPSQPQEAVQEVQPEKNAPNAPEASGEARTKRQRRKKPADKKKPEKVVVSFRSLPEDADRWRNYADRKGLKFEAFFRFAADEYMKNHGDD